jgi:hypothetical protein
MIIERGLASDRGYRGIRARRQQVALVQRSLCLKP